MIQRACDGLIPASLCLIKRGGGELRKGDECGKDFASQPEAPL